MRILIFLLLSVISLADDGYDYLVELGRNATQIPQVYLGDPLKGYSVVSAKDLELNWVKDPNFLPAMFSFYKGQTGNSYLFVIIENWLLYNPYVESWEIRNEINTSIDVTYSDFTTPFITYGYSIKIIEEGRRYPALMVGDLNFDGVTNLEDFSIWASKDKPEVSLVDVVNIIKVIY